MHAQRERREGGKGERDKEKGERESE